MSVNLTGLIVIEQPISDSVYFLYNIDQELTEQMLRLCRKCPVLGCFEH